MKRLIRHLLVGLFDDPFPLRIYQRAMIERRCAARSRQPRLLDLGAGELALSLRFRRRHPDWKIEACDLQFSDEVRRRAERAGIPLHVTDGRSFPGEPRAFDVILLSSVLQMVPDPAALLSGCRDGLARDGVIVLTVPSRYRWLEHWCGQHGGWRGQLVRILRLPKTAGALYADLDRRFGVQGPTGTYTVVEIEAVVRRAGFLIVSHDRVPGPVATWVWEASLALSWRWGSWTCWLLGLFAPVIWLLELLVPPADVGEHLLVLEPIGPTVAPSSAQSLP